MHDQADKLRSLMLQAMRAGAAAIGPAPYVVVLAGGKGGVGTTTLAVNLAVAAASDGSRIVLVDGNFRRPDVARLCGISEHHTIADILANRRNIHEVLQPGPAGIQVASGPWAPEQMTSCPLPALDRLIGQIKTLGRHADCVLIDAGSGADEITKRFWAAADHLAMVTTPDALAVMDTYAVLKLHQREGVTIHRPGLIVNRSQPDEAAEVFDRVERSARRFLAVEMLPHGMVPEEEGLAASGRMTPPYYLRQEGSSTSAALVAVVGSLRNTRDADSPARRAA